MIISLHSYKKSDREEVKNYLIDEHGFKDLEEIPLEVVGSGLGVYSTIIKLSKIKKIKELGGVIIKVSSLNTDPSQMEGDIQFFHDWDGVILTHPNSVVSKKRIENVLRGYLLNA